MGQFQNFFITSLLFLTLAATKIKADETADPNVMEANGFQSYKSKKEFNETKYGERIQKTYNNLIKFGVVRMKRKGYNAEPLLKEWTRLYSTRFLAAEINLSAVEDHDPALIWLDNFYKKLTEVLGQNSVNAMHLNDIDVLNRAVPVVFKPKGAMQDDYNDCFVRSAKAIGYWGVMGACSTYNWLGLSPVITICSPLSEAGRLAFGIIADPISNQVWKNANKL